MKIAYFITPHGFGHAARAAAVILALRRQTPDIEVDVFTTVPLWFFRDSLGDNFRYHVFASDVGLVQSTPFVEDLPATINALNNSLMNSHSQLNSAVDVLRKQNCEVALCDIAPFGIDAAHAAGLPAVLVENFTWDFIYTGYNGSNPEFHPHIDRLKAAFSKADLHIQTMPVCKVVTGAEQVAPVSRLVRESKEGVRDRLGVSTTDRLILVTMGGIEEKCHARAALKQHSESLFLLPGSAERSMRDGNLILLPYHSDYYHPDLVNASDAVIGKLGYSTVAEVYHAGIPFGYIPRPTFPETPSMAEFVQREMAGIEFSLADFLDGQWGDLPERLLSAPRVTQSRENGADQIAQIILRCYS